MDFDAFLALIAVIGSALAGFSVHRRSQDDHKLLEAGADPTDVLDDRAERRHALVKYRWPTAIVAMALIGGGVGSIVMGGGRPGAPGGTPPESYSAPDTPSLTATMFAATGDSLRLVGSAFSGDLDDTHDSTHVQVDSLGGDWASPSYWDQRLGQVLTDTATAIDSAAVVQSRIRYRGNDGGWSAWSDSAQTTMAFGVPSTPTVDAVVFASTADSLRVVGSAYSHPDGASHDSTAIQVDTTGGDFSSPQYHDVVLGAVTTDTVTALDSAAFVDVRMRYKGGSGWSGWDTLQVEMVEGATPFFSDGFESGDLSHTEGGAAWITSPYSNAGAAMEPVQTQPRTGLWSTRFWYNGGTAELRFDSGYDSLTEIWYEFYVYWPADWDHPDSGGLDNDKFFAAWGGDNGGYSTANGTPFIILEFTPATVSDSTDSEGRRNSDLRITYNDGSSRINLGASPEYYRAWLSDSGPLQRGQYNRFRIYLDVGTSADDDGIIRIWTGDTQIYNWTSAPFWSTGGTYDPGWGLNYLMGSSATDVPNTTWYIDDFKMYDSDPGW